MARSSDPISERGWRRDYMKVSLALRTRLRALDALKYDQLQNQKEEFIKRKGEKPKIIEKKK
jgi:hypothetical protein